MIDLDSKRLPAQHQKRMGLIGIYERFEQTMAFLLSGIIAIVIVISFFQLCRTVYHLLFINAFDPMDYVTFQTIFGMIMTLLIAMEFKHSILKVALRKNSIIQVKTVVLIALIALSRKFVILGIGESSEKIAALAFSVLALGAVYWLLTARDQVSSPGQKRSDG